MRTTKANIFESYVFVDISTLFVPSLSIKIILAFEFAFWMGELHNHIPRVQELIVDATSNPLFLLFPYQLDHSTLYYQALSLYG